MDDHELEIVPLPPSGGKIGPDNNAPMIAVGFVETTTDAARASRSGNDATEAHSGTEVDSGFLLEPDCDSAPEAEAAAPPPLSPSSSFNLLPDTSFGASNAGSKGNAGAEAYQAAYGDDDIDAQIKQIVQSSSAQLKKKGLGFALSDPPSSTLSNPTPDASAVTDSCAEIAEGTAGAPIEEPVVKKKKKKKGVGFASFAVDDVAAADGGTGLADAPPKTATFAGSDALPADSQAQPPATGKPKKKKGIGFAGFSVDTTTSFETGNEGAARIAATPAAATSPRGLHANENDPLEESTELGKAEASPSDSLKASRSTARFFDEDTNTGIGTGTNTHSSSSDAVLFEETDHLKFATTFDAEDNEKDAGHFSRPSSAGSTRSRGGGSAGDAGDRESGTGVNHTDIQDVTYMASAAQFRRIERANRHYSIACDVWCGIEETRNLRKGLATLAAATCFVPLTVAVVCYSSWTLNDVDSKTNKALYTLSTAIAFAVQGVVLVESFSSVVCEIEFGVVVAEELPILYAKVIGSTTACIIITQQCMYAVYDVYFTGGLLGLSNPDHRAWLGQLLGGFIGSLLPIALTFFRHAPAMVNSEMTWVFVFWAAGCCLCLLVVPAVYGMFAVLLATYGHAGNGAVGALLAFIFPFFTPFVKMIAHEYAHWGEGRQRLYDGAVLDVLADSIHAAVLCLLVVAVNFTSVDLVLLLLAQATIYTWRVLNLLSASASGFSICKYVVPWMADKRVGIKESPSSSPTRYHAAGSTSSTASVSASDVQRGISADALESYPFVKQCAKLRDITSLLCSLALGTSVSLSFVLFTLIVSASQNDSAFAGPGLWALGWQDVGVSSMSGTFQRLIVLFCFQCLAFLLVLCWMQSNGHALGVMLYQLEFTFSQLPAAAATYAVVAILGAVLHGNGMNA